MLINLDSIPAFYKNYVKLIEEEDLLQAMRISGHRAAELVHSLPESKADHRYEKRKWSLREVLCHAMDAERIFAYRALRFARNDQTPLAAFDENTYTPQSNASGRTLRRIADEMARLRDTNLDLFESFTPEMLQRKGTINGNTLSVAALGFIIAGHETHHCGIIRDRYLGLR